MPAGWYGGNIEYLVRDRLDRELEASLLGDRLEYIRAREHMPRDVRIREDRVLGGTDG